MSHTPTNHRLETATLGGGCFWCLDASYRRIRGVTKVVSGYAGGTLPHPSYDQVVRGTTGHAETVQITFDPSIITYSEILEIFWAIHNPTTLNQQGHDVGTEYRSIILYHNANQQVQAEASKRAVQTLWPDPVVTEIVPLEKFYPAEPYHQDYFDQHPEQAYCQIIINPKLEKLKREFAAKLH